MLNGISHKRPLVWLPAESRGQNKQLTAENPIKCKGQGPMCALAYYQINYKTKEINKTHLEMHKQSKRSLPIIVILTQGSVVVVSTP